MRIQLVTAVVLCLFAADVCFSQASIPADKSVKRLPNVAKNATLDLAVTPAGSLVGMAVDRQGKAEAGAVLELLSRSKVVASAKSDIAGRFAFEKAPIGPLVLRCANSTQPVRVWKSGFAPPRASDSVLFVAGAETVRGQCCETGDCGSCDACGGGFQGHFGGVFQNILRNPWLVGVGAAAAIAIPIAAADDDERANDTGNQLAAPTNDDGDAGAGEPADAS